jgi:hypothetical protein
VRILWLIKLLIAPAMLIGGAGGLAPAITPVAAAETCDAWDASMQEDEGGSVLTANACAGGDDNTPGLTIQCFDKVNIRYDLGEQEPVALQPGMTARFTFTSGAKTVTEKFDYEDMDGMFAAYLPQTNPLLALLRSGDRVTVTDAAGKFRPHDFSLSGSTAAIGKVLAGCGKAPAGGD